MFEIFAIVCWAVFSFFLGTQKIKEKKHGLIARHLVLRPLGRQGVQRPESFPVDLESVQGRSENVQLRI